MSLINAHFRILVRRLDGTVLTDDLPHAKADCEIRGMQAGAASGFQPGNFSIELLPPTANDKEPVVLNLGLREQMRVEMYLGYEIAGNPWFTGIIRQLPKHSNQWTVTGVDSIWILESAKTHRAEFFKGTTQNLARLGLKAPKKTYGHKLDSLTGFNNLGGWTSTTNEGLPAVHQASGTPGGNGLLITNASFPNSAYADAAMRVYFHEVMGTQTNAGNMGINAGNLAIVVAYQDANNFIIAESFARYKNAQLWEIDLQLVRFNAGAWTILDNVSIVVPALQADFRAQLEFIGQQRGADYNYRIKINGIDPGCFYNSTNTDPAWMRTPSGAIGLRFNPGNNNGGPNVYCSQLVFHSRYNAMTEGTFAASVKSIQQAFTRTPMLELLGIASVTEGFQYRKNPLPVTDSVDWGNLGVNTGFRFAESNGENDQGGLTANSSVDPNADTLATVVELSVSAGADNAGMITWDDLDAQDLYGVVGEAVTASHLTDYISARTTAAATMNLRSTPSQAKSLEVLNTPETFGRFRELDLITIHSPERLNLTEQLVRVMSIKITEGSVTTQVTGDQYPFNQSEMMIRKRWQNEDAQAAGVQGLSPSTGQGLVYDNNYGAPSIIKDSNQQVVDATHEFRLRFHIPKNVAMIQQYMLNFTLGPFRSAKQSSSSSVSQSSGASSTSSSGASSTSSSVASGSHNHDVTIPSHSHTIPDHVHRLFTSTLDGSPGGTPAVSKSTLTAAYGGTITGDGSTGNTTWQYFPFEVKSESGTAMTIWMPMTVTEEQWDNGPPNHYKFGHDVWSIMDAGLNSGTAGGASSVSAPGSVPTSTASGSHAHNIDHFHGIDHYHIVNIPSLSLLDPDSIAEFGQASSCHVWCDGTDITAYLAGPFSGGDFEDLDITNFVIGGGYHEILISSATLGTITATTEGFLLIKPVS